MKKILSVFNIKIIIMIVLLLISAVIVSAIYNISFKYDKNDPFIKNIIERSYYLPNSYIQKKFLNCAVNVTKVFNQSLIQKNEIVNNIEKGTFNKDYLESLTSENSKVLKPCKDLDICFSSSYTDIYNKKFDDLFEKDFLYFKFKNNATLALKIISPACKAARGNANTICAMGFIDINGKKGPNRLGYDLLDIALSYYPSFALNKEQYSVIAIVPLYWKDAAIKLCTNGIGYGCSWFVTYNKSRADYLMPLKNVKSKYIFNKYFHYMYITPKGKWIFFNNEGIVEAVTWSSIIQKSKLFLRYQYYIKIYPVEKSLESFSFRVKTSFYDRFPNLYKKNKPKKQVENIKKL